MKAKIHPQYYPKTKITCNCGASFEIGSTQESIKVEVCSNCHPFYTGKSNLIDTAGRVERFQVMRQKAQELKQQRSQAGKDKKIKRPKIRIDIDATKENLKALKKKLDK